MDKEIIEKYLEKVPAEIRIPIKKLKNDQIWAVYISLVNEKPKFYSQLETQFKANPTEMSRALKGLVECGLIDRKTERFGDIGNPRKVFYSPTPLGIKFYDALFDIIIPPELIRQSQMQTQGTETVDWSKSGGKELMSFHDGIPQKMRTFYHGMDKLSGSNQFITERFVKAEGL